NYGYQLELLDPDTGAPVWPARARILRDPLDPGHACLNKVAVYYANRTFLCARSLANGKLLWARPLPGPRGTWGTMCCGDWLLAYPVDRAARPLTFAWPILICDPKDGALVQRLNFAADPLETAVQVVPDGLVVASGRGVWGLSSATREQDR